MMKISNFKYIVKKSLVLVLVLSVSFLNGCGREQVQDQVDYRDVPFLEADAVMEGLQNRDPSIIAEKICPYVRENYPNLEDRITDWMAYIEGDIASYDEAQLGSSSKGNHYGDIIKYAVCIDIANVKTSTGRTYEIIFHTNVIYDECPEIEGITFLRILDQEQYDAQDGLEYSVEGISKDLEFPGM